MDKPVVSVFMLTYNQEQFIGQAIESILGQKTTFTIQLVIGEDCSTDASRAICERYATAFPDRIKLLPSLGKNIGLIANYVRTLKECNGSYIAICDGDDYWTDDLKLQKQVDFLENNQDYSIVYTAVNRLFENETQATYSYVPAGAELGFEELVNNNFIHSVTALFRNIPVSLDPVPTWLLEVPFGDWQTYLWTIKDGGKIYFINEVTAVYRMDIGVTSKFKTTNSAFLQTLVSILKKIYLDDNFKTKRNFINASILSKKRDVISSLNREGQFTAAFLFFIKTIVATNEKYHLLKFYLYSLFKGNRKNKMIN